MRKAFKYRLYPNRSQAEALDAMLDTHRRLYNSALEERREVYEAQGRSVSYKKQSAKLKEARNANPYLARTNISSTQATLRRLERSFEAFFRRVKAGGEAPGYPRFKGRDRFRLVEFPSYGDGCRLKDNGRLYLQNIGHIKVKLHRAIEGKVKTCSVKKSCGKWYAIFSCDLGDAPEVTYHGAAVGIDLGLKAFLATSDGEAVEPPRYYRKAQKKLRLAQRCVSRKQRGSNRCRKARERVGRLHEKTANQRRDFHHKQARKLVDAHCLIVHEVLNVRGIARTQFAKSTYDAGWARFVTILQSKAEEAGVAIVAVDPKNTTQMCSNCGELPEVKKMLSERVHSCSCGYVVDRDVNAAQNILRLGRSHQDETQRVAAYVS